MAQLGVTILPFSNTCQCIVLYGTYAICNKYLCDVHSLCTSENSGSSRDLRAKLKLAFDTVGSWGPSEINSLNVEIMASRPLFQPAVNRVIEQCRRDLKKADITTTAPNISPAEFIHTVLTFLIKKSEIENLSYFGPCGFQERLTLVHSAIVDALQVVSNATRAAPVRQAEPAGAIEHFDSVSNSGRGGEGRSSGHRHAGRQGRVDTDGIGDTMGHRGAEKKVVSGSDGGHTHGDDLAEFDSETSASASVSIHASRSSHNNE